MRAPAPPPGVTIETTSLGYLPNIMAPENRKYHSFTLLPEVLGVDPTEHGLGESGGFVQITSYNALLNPSSREDPQLGAHIRRDALG